MATRILMADGRDVIVALSGKRVAEVLAEAITASGDPPRFATPSGSHVWVTPTHVAAIEELPDG